MTTRSGAPRRRARARARARRAGYTLVEVMIAIAILMVPVCFFVAGLWKVALGLFILGWVLQFVGHYFEGKPPEFFKDWRFLFVGLRWWFKKVVGIKG